MKKSGLLVMPLMTISLLVSCGGSMPANKCKVTVGDHSHLSFTTIDDKTLDAISIDKNKDFTFKMKAVAESNSEGYKLPTQLLIYVGNSTVELEHKYYTIDEITPQYEAAVTIKGEKVTDDIKISGKGVPQGYYAVDVSKCFGVSAKIETQYSPYLYTNQDGIVTFTKEDDFELPAAENIIVKFDNNDWISPASASSSKWCTYDANAHKLTLKKDKARSNVMIGARSPQFNILEASDWKDISDYSTAGYAPLLFYVGDTKTVKVNDLDHKVRIIGFNHDELSTSTEGDPQYAGITFEFADVITNSNGKAVTTCWNNKYRTSSTNYNFPDSTLNNLLNNTGQDNCIFNKLPEGLQGAIKEVKKPIAFGEEYEVKNDKLIAKLFPLSYKEMTKGTVTFAKEEGSIYSFYQGSGDISTNRIKKEVGGTDGLYYWLRSPCITGNHSAMNIYPDGTYGSLGFIYAKLYAIAPAFCI